MIPVGAPAFVLVDALDPLGCWDVLAADAFLLLFAVSTTIPDVILIGSKPFFWLLHASVGGLLLELVFLLQIVHHISLKVERVEESSLGQRLDVFWAYCSNGEGAIAILDERLVVLDIRDALMRKADRLNECSFTSKNLSSLIIVSVFLYFSISLSIAGSFLSSESTDPASEGPALMPSLLRISTSPLFSIPLNLYIRNDKVQA